MADLNGIVDIAISRTSVVPSIANFGAIMIAAEFLTTAATPNYAADERVREFASLDEVGTVFGTSGIVYQMASAAFSGSPRKVNKLYIGRKLTGGDGTETWTAALTAMKADNNKWYGFAVGTRTLADQQEAAAWSELNDKLLGLATGDANAINSTGDIIEYLQTQNYDRSYGQYDVLADLSGTDVFPELRWMGKQFPKNAGSSNWAWKVLTGVTPSDLTVTQQNTVIDKNGNIYITVSDVSHTQFGTVGSGEYLDIIRGTDWLMALIQQRLFALNLATEKLGFTNGGIAQALSTIRGALQEGIDQGLLSSYVVPDINVADVSAADKGNRLLPDISFTAVYQGAINRYSINGIITV